MASTTVKSTYMQGVTEGAPFIFMAFPFSLLFGVIAADAGLTLLEAVGFSVVVIAGASQFAALQLMTESAPIWIILAASLAVNLRMAMYSASLAVHLGAAPLWQRAVVAYVNFDQSYSMSIAKYEKEPDLSIPQKIAYFIGVVTFMLPSWIGGTIIGVIAGDAIPAEFGLDFAMPMLFLALVAPMMKSLAHVAAAATAVVVSLAFWWLPSGTGILLAGLTAMIVGAYVETRMPKART